MKINVNNTEKINATLKNVNGNATAHTYNDQSEIVGVCEAVEEKLHSMLGAKKNWRDVEVWAVSGETLAEKL